MVVKKKDVLLKGQQYKKIKTFDKPTAIEHSNIKHVLYSDFHCTAPEWRYDSVEKVESFFFFFLS